MFGSLENRLKTLPKAEDWNLHWGDHFSGPNFVKQQVSGTNVRTDVVTYRQNLTTFIKNIKKWKNSIC